MNPDTEVTSRKRVHNATLHRCTRDDHRIGTPHCSACRFAERFLRSVSCIIIRLLQFEPTKAKNVGVLQHQRGWNKTVCIRWFGLLIIIIFNYKTFSY